MVALSKVIYAKFKDTLLKCLLWAKFLDGTVVMGSPPAQPAANGYGKVHGISLSINEMLFVKDLIEAENKRIWQSTYFPAISEGRSNMDAATKELKNVVVYCPNSPEAYCFHLMERINKREYEVSIKGKRKS